MNGMRLHVGPDAWVRGRLLEAGEAWTCFGRAIVAGPPGIACLEVYGDGIGETVAITEPQPGCEDFWIVLGRRFFERPTEEQQVLTLLHECLHVRLHAGPLRERTEAGLLLNQQNWPPQGRHRDFLGARYDIACKYRNFADEMLAEQSLKQDFRDWFARRWTYYLNTRRTGFNGRRFDQGYENLKDFAFAYEFLRMSLGARLAEDQAQRNEFTAMADQLWGDLEVRCANAEQSTKCERLRQLCRRMLELNLQSGPPYDLAAFDGAFEWMMATPSPPF